MSRRPLIFLLTSNTISITGNVFTMLAVPWFVLETTGSTTRTGLAAFASMLPVIISATFAGTLVDRLGLRRSSVLSDLMSGLIVAAIPTLFLTTGLSYGLMLALLFVRWLLATPGDTAREAMIPDLAERGRVSMERATAAYDSVYRSAQMAGAALGGVLIAWLGPTALLFVDGATFLSSALLVHFGVPQFVHETSEPGVGRYLHGLKEGMSFLWHDRLQRWAVAMILVSNLLDIGLSQVLLPTYARDVLHDSRAFGLLLGAVGAGSVVGSIIYGAVGARLPRRMTFAVCFLIGAIPRPLVLAVGAPFWIAVVITFVAGLAAGAINPLLGVMQFERIPARLRARVLGAITAGAYAGMPLGGLLAGSLADIIDLKATLLLFTLIYLLASMPPFLSRAWQEFDRAKPSSGAAPKQDADDQREEIEHK